MLQTRVIPKTLVKLFTERKKLLGMVSFLLYLRKRTNLRKFYSFCNSRNIKLDPKVTLAKGILFHGSPREQFSLTPNASMRENGKAEKETLVYATEEPNYAIFLAVLDIRENGSASVMIKKKKIELSVSLDFVNGLSRIQKGYIHIVPREFFKKTKNEREYKTNKSVDVLFTIPVMVQDLEVPIYIKTEENRARNYQ